MQSRRFLAAEPVFHSQQRAARLRKPGEVKAFILYRELTFKYARNRNWNDPNICFSFSPLSSRSVPPSLSFYRLLLLQDVYRRCISPGGAVGLANDACMFYTCMRWTLRDSIVFGRSGCVLFLQNASRNVKAFAVVTWHDRFSIQLYQILIIPN